ncbi:MAG: biotin--[acetyl-CoA-carboxylase] ligase [Desulforudis sp.]|jgi:BirA family biotin operon repressor/biotin-[acetyl-CoA-carboxylase] ligase|nr:biotin--[acetyl-CoA-carboxylase] ligase [Clostridia bacterium]MDQ7791917.1 biotin--[acetyl-CoA-carboxylase] ligase [Clostridia bacterium]RJX22256.1 MAG: biotin--[acetyl-CoA-carboxylase] ligase [Desulforudis sp.]
MKSAVLGYLKERCPNYVSGEEICRSLNISRTSVWKYVSTLRNEGYEIEARSRLGYRLVGTPDLLLPDEVVTGLDTLFCGQVYHHHLSLPSTNTTAQELARAGAPEGTVVLAEEQTGGRGRLSRAWVSPLGGLWFSIILRPTVLPARAPEITFLAAVACVQAFERYPGVDVGIKWPNDLVWRDRKLGGILTELSGEFDRVNHVVLGVGINVNLNEDDFPPGLRAVTTSVSAITGFPVSRRRLLRELLVSLEHWYRVWLADGFSPVVEAWKRMHSWLDRPVRVVNVEGEWTGIAVGIDDDGALLLKTDNGLTKRIIAGDVLLRDGERLDPRS